MHFLDLPFMFFACFLVWPLMLTGRVLDRREGGLMLTAYLAYVTFLFLAKTGV